MRYWIEQHETSQNRKVRSNSTTSDQEDCYVHDKNSTTQTKEQELSSTRKALPDLEQKGHDNKNSSDYRQETKEQQN